MLIFQLMVDIYKSGLLLPSTLLTVVTISLKIINILSLVVLDISIKVIVIIIYKFIYI